MKKLFLFITILPSFLFCDMYETPKDMLEIGKKQRIGHQQELKEKQILAKRNSENIKFNKKVNGQYIIKEPSDSYSYLSASYFMGSKVTMYSTGLGFAFNDWIDTRLFYESNQLTNDFVAHKVGNLYGVSILNFKYFKLNVIGSFSLALIKKTKVADNKVLAFGYGAELELIPTNKLRLILAVKQDIMHISDQNVKTMFYGIHIKIAPFL